MAYPGERRYMNKIWDDLIDHVANAWRTTLAAGSAVVGRVAIDHTTPGDTDMVESRPSCRRNAGADPRDGGVTAADKLAQIANVDPTSDLGAGMGSLSQSTTYYTTAIPRNYHGAAAVTAAIDTQATGAYGANTGAIQITIPQVVGADFYDVFLSTDAAPKWVGRISEAQRAAGDYMIDAVGGISIGGGNPPGTVRINVAGTGLQTSNAIFAYNNGYLPERVVASDGYINCAGYSRAHIYVSLGITGLDVAPVLSIVPFLRGQDGGWYQCELRPLSLLGATGCSLMQDFEMDVDGATGLTVLVDTIAGSAFGYSASFWVELA